MIWERVRSRQPMAKTMAPAWMGSIPSRAFTAVRDKSLFISKTMVSGRHSISSCFTRRAKCSAYSGPVRRSFIIKVPNPSWMHWGRMPPRVLSLSRRSTFSAPCARALNAAAIPAGPPPIITTSALFIFLRPPSRFHRQRAVNQPRLWSPVPAVYQAPGL